MKAYFLLLPAALFITACSSSHSGAGSAHKRHGGHKPNVNLIVLDTNKDNRVSRAEFLSAKLPNGRRSRATMFNRIDKNQDGYITQREIDRMKAMRGKHKSNY